jgi:hypothetical protein
MGQALALDALEGEVRALAIAEVFDVVTKIELGGVAVQMALSHVVIGADHAALEDRKEVLDRVGVVVLDRQASRLCRRAGSSTTSADSIRATSRPRSDARKGLARRATPGCSAARRA